VIDVLVAGGGPAGLVTALHAARAGMSTVVLEPRAAPIDKACGEGLMPGAVRALAELGVDPPGMRFRGIRYVDDGRSVQAHFRDGVGRGVRRVALHAALLDAAVSAGVRIEVGRVVDVSQDGDAVSAGGFRARYLAAADGLHSPVRRRLGISVAARGRRRWGVRAHFAVAPWADLVEVHWSPHAEAYVTPVAPDCVGVAVLSSTQAPYAEQLAAFPELAALGAPMSEVRAAGPLRQDVARRVVGRVLLVGDAAGYVDALTGEGLALSFACADALVARIRSDSVAGYEGDYQRISRRYRWLTTSLLWASGRPALRRRIVPLATHVPPVFRAAVNALA
jgi:flavin-dependent dehydrogenase